MDVFTSGVIETAIAALSALGFGGIVAFAVVSNKKLKLRAKELELQAREVAVKEQELLYQRDKLALMHDALDKESVSKLLKD